MSNSASKISKTIAFTASLIVLAACGHPEKDRFIVSGNTLDQFNDLAHSAPDHVNINISYEFEFVDSKVSKWSNDAHWVFKGRLEDMYTRSMLISYVPDYEDDTIPPGQVVAQGPIRVTNLDTCVPPGSVLEDDQQEVFGDAVRLHHEIGDIPNDQNFFVRRMIANSTEEGGRRFEATYFVAIDDTGYTCEDLNSEEDNQEIIDLRSKWRAEALRAYEIIG